MPCQPQPRDLQSFWTLFFRQLLGQVARNQKTWQAARHPGFAPAIGLLPKLGHLVLAGAETQAICGGGGYAQEAAVCVAVNVHCALNTGWLHSIPVQRLTSIVMHLGFQTQELFFLIKGL